MVKLPGTYCESVAAAVCAACPLQQTDESTWQTIFEGHPDVTPADAGEEVNFRLAEEITFQQGQADWNEERRAVISAAIDDGRLSPDNREGLSPFEPDQEALVVAVSIRLKTEGASWQPDHGQPSVPEQMGACVVRNLATPCLPGLPDPA